MADLRIDCINKTDRASAHERIHNVGGVQNGTRWKQTETASIAAIESGQHTYYVEQPVGHRVNVIIAQLNGKKYLKTEADGEQPNNLLALPECP